MKRIFSTMMSLLAMQFMFAQSTENPKIDLTLKEYYVKVDGTGDGTSWDKAISAKDFAYVFGNFQTEGATFYVAGGTYLALYNTKGEELTDRTACWVSQHGANIYGGYDPAATGNAKTTMADPSKFKTIFSGDLKGDDDVVISDDCNDSFENFDDNTTSSLITMSIASDVRVSGIELTGMSFSRGTSPAMIRMSAEEGTKYNVTIDHCKLYVADKGIEMNRVSNLVVDQCEFDYIRNAAVYSNRDMYVTNSTFTYTNGVNYNGDNTVLVVKNSTFVKNTSDIQAFDYNNESSSTVVNVYNNTFIPCKKPANFVIADNVTAFVEGNIFAGSDFFFSNTGYELRLKTFTNNLFACELPETDVVSEKNNVKIENAIPLYKGVFDGKYSKRDSVFTPNLTYKNTSTRTVALLTDSLDTISLRFPRLDSIWVDQRGELRFDSTCMGAYEIGCPADTTFSTCTSVVGSEFFDGKVYDKIGRYSKIVLRYERTTTICDSIVCYTLDVIPDPSNMEYYVKKVGTGRADGSDWDNAMGEKDFAFVFRTLQKEGVTFYVAGGTYHPVYNYNGDETNDRNVFWKSQHGANIYGGYDPNATGNARTTKADPSKFKTIFSGDLKEDDEIVMKDDCDFTFGNFTDNTVALLSMDIASNVHISGIELTGMSFSRGTSPAMLGLYAAVGTSYKATIDSCRLYVGDKGIEVNNVKDLLVDQCEFSYILNAAAYSNRNMKVTNSTITYTNGVNYNGNNTELVVENSTFVKNTSDIQAFDYNNESSSTVVKVNNNTFISCKDDANFVIGDNVTAFVEGNIFTDSDFFISKTGYELKTKTYTNNLIAGKFTESEIVSEKNNIRLENAIPLYESVFDGKYSKKDSVFTPNLTYKDAYTRTVALLKDSLDSISLRIPRIANIIADQRGVTRFDNTCLGAYEIGCPSDTTFSTCTIAAGSKFYDGKVYDKIGCYTYIVLSYERTSSICDSVVCYTLNVVPDSSKNEFYVKEQGTGKEDGSNWDNAFGAKDFAFVFGNLQREGVTFYMAAGTYYAVYNSDGKETNDKTAHWVSKHGANIYGGYNPKATGDASSTKSNPILYKTIFTGDIKGDDKVAIKDDCEDILENFGDNMVSSMLVMNVASDVHISGIELKALSFARGTAPAMIQLNAPKGTDYKATIDYCKLYASDKGLEVNNIGSLYVDQCEFEHLRNAAVFSNRNMYVTNCTFTYTNGVNYNGNNSELVVENSTFVKNTSDIQAYDYNNEKSSTTVKVNNNTFLSCKDGSNFVLGDNVAASVVGNIFAGAKLYISKTGYELNRQSFVNNLLACNSYNNTDAIIEKDNIKLESATPLYSNGIFEGSYSEADDKFTPDLTYKQAPTRTVALLKDNLSDGTSLRFARPEKITVDQRGVSRSDMTCMGAYEKEKESGVDDVNDTVCEVYPNPVKEVLNVSGCGDSFSYEIVDLTGRTVARGKSAGTIAVSNLSNGVYLLKLQSEKQQACVRFVKQ